MARRRNRCMYLDCTKDGTKPLKSDGQTIGHYCKKHAREIKDAILDRNSGWHWKRDMILRGYDNGQHDKR